MAWKYWDPRPDWPEPRSYLYERDGELQGHVALWPAVWPPPGPRGVHMIDWAAVRESPGAGLAMVQKLARMYDFIIAIGGAEMTRKVLPAYGFAEVARTWMAARPLRPVAQALDHQSRNWKLPVRVVRNWWWSRSPAASAPAEWSASAITPAEIAVEAPAQSIPRTPEFFAYLLGCPAARSSLYALRRGGKPEGHFALSVVRGQARLAGVWLRQPSEEAWRAAFLLAQRAARAIAGANEFGAKGTDGASRRAAESAGLRMAGAGPVFLLDKKGLFPKVQEFQFQLIDDDGAFLDLGRADYLT